MKKCPTHVSTDLKTLPRTPYTAHSPLPNPAQTAPLTGMLRRRGFVEKVVAPKAPFVAAFVALRVRANVASNNSGSFYCCSSSSFHSALEYPQNQVPIYLPCLFLSQRRSERTPRKKMSKLSSIKTHNGTYCSCSIKRNFD